MEEKSYRVPEGDKRDAGEGQGCGYESRIYPGINSIFKDYSGTTVILTV